MVHHDPAADPCRGMNVDGEELRNPALQKITECRPSAFPEPVRDPMTLQRMKTFKEQKCLDVAVTRGIALENGRKVRADRFTDIAVSLECLVEKFARLHCAQFFAADFPREVIG